MEGASETSIVRFARQESGAQDAVPSPSVHYVLVAFNPNRKESREENKGSAAERTLDIGAVARPRQRANAMRWRLAHLTSPRDPTRSEVCERAQKPITLSTR